MLENSGIVAYVRVSSKGQDDAMQRAAIVGRVNPTVWYAEKRSASTNNRPELKRLLQDLRQGLVKEIYVFKLDRLCRAGVGGTFAIVDEIRKAGVTLHCIADNITIKPGNDVVSDVMVFALGLAAGLERAAIGDRIAAAMAHKEAKGEPWGRVPTMTPALIESAKRMQSEGRSVRTISAALGVSKSVVGRCLKAA